MRTDTQTIDVNGSACSRFDGHKAVANLVMAGKPLAQLGHNGLERGLHHRHQLLVLPWNWLPATASPLRRPAAAAWRRAPPAAPRADCRTSPGFYSPSLCISAVTLPSFLAHLGLIFCHRRRRRRNVLAVAHSALRGDRQPLLGAATLLLGAPRSPARMILTHARPSNTFRSASRCRGTARWSLRGFRTGEPSSPVWTLSTNA